jgi:hypothetical protein
MPRPTRAQVENAVRRAAGRCEYCRFPITASRLPFHCDHVIAEKHGGTTTLKHLAWACFRCNMSKGPNIAGLDSLTETLTRLFHPRQDVWEEHFEWDTAWLRGRTAIGRTTIAVLEINDADVVALRESLLAEGGWDQR